MNWATFQFSRKCQQYKFYPTKYSRIFSDNCHLQNLRLVSKKWNIQHCRRNSLIKRHKLTKCFKVGSFEAYDASEWENVNNRNVNNRRSSQRSTWAYFQTLAIGFRSAKSSSSVQKMERHYSTDEEHSFIKLHKVTKGWKGWIFLKLMKLCTLCKWNNSKGISKAISVLKPCVNFLVVLEIGFLFQCQSRAILQIQK